MASAPSSLCQVCVVLFLASSLGRCSVEQMTWKQDAVIKNAIFHRDLLFTMTDRLSAIDCGRRCSQTENCVSFTFTRHSSSRGACRGHSSSLTSQTPSSTEPGTEAYSFVGKKVWLDPAEQQLQSDWVRKKCATDLDCPADNATCFRNMVCLCLPGYYYSHKGDNCVPECSPADLQTGFMDYPSGLLNSHVLHYVPSGVSLLHCQRYCTRDAVCRAITFVRSSGMCMTHHVTPLDADDVHVCWFPDMTPHFYSQLTCA
ncbi:hypothetical protein BaRGS_00039635 [Batillaria attramentaria]|uniref:Apple domain-containing protein n=1 Tax=Batillaria attramentaria TaxID=370345 RepID=A0ABD0J3I6_9CAEN